MEACPITQLPAMGCAIAVSLSPRKAMSGSHCQLVSSRCVTLLHFLFVKPFAASAPLCGPQQTLLWHMQDPVYCVKGRYHCPPDTRTPATELELCNRPRCCSAPFITGSIWAAMLVEPAPAAPPIPITPLGPPAQPFDIGNAAVVMHYPSVVCLCRHPGGPCPSPHTHCSRTSHPACSHPCTCAVTLAVPMCTRPYDYFACVCISHATGGPHPLNVVGFCRCASGPCPSPNTISLGTSRPAYACARTHSCSTHACPRAGPHCVCCACPGAICSLCIPFCESMSPCSPSLTLHLCPCTLVHVHVHWR